MSTPEIPASGPRSATGAPGARPEHAVLGTWRLVSWEARSADGAVDRPFGDRPVGYAVYTADGHFFAQLMRPGRPDFVGGGLILGGTAEENAVALRGYIAYGGTYEIEDGGVVHHVEMSLFPNWIGSGQRRTIEWDAGHLVLSPPPVLTERGTLVHRLTWERVVSNAGA